MQLRSGCRPCHGGVCDTWCPDCGLHAVGAGKLARALVRQAHGFHAAGPWEYANLRDCRFTAEEVPSHLPLDWYEKYFADFADHVPHPNLYTVRHLRRAAPLKLVEMTAGGSWLQCARALDIPEGRARSALIKLRGQFGESDGWSRFVEVAEQLACHLDQLPRRVNYALRRRTLATWQMPHSDWTELCDGLPQANRLTSRYGTMLGTVLVWAETTQSDYLLCPLLRAPRTAGTDLTRLIDKISQLLTPANQKGRSLEFLRNVAKYSRDLGAHCDK